MMIPSMRTLSAAITFALLAFFVSSCSQPSGPAASGSKSFGATPPTWSSSNFNLATPVLQVTQTGDGELSLYWPNGRTEASIVSGGQYYPVNWTGANVIHGVKNGSQHTDVFIWNATTSAWDLYAQPVGQHLTITGLADGTYTFYVKEKSKENSTAKNTETFHSYPSNVVEYTIHTSCLPTNTFFLVFGEQLNDNDNDHVQLTSTYQITSTAPSHKFNLHFTLGATCDEYQFDPNNAPVVTLQIGSEAVVTAFWNGSKYIANNIECGNDLGVKTFTIKVDGVTIPGNWTVDCE